MFQILTKLKEDGALKHFVKNGLMSPKVFMYLEIYMWVDAKQKSTGTNINAIVSDAEKQFDKSRTTIWRAIRIIRAVVPEVK